MAPFTTKQSLEIEQLQNFWTRRSRRASGSWTRRQHRAEEDEKKDDEEVARSALGRLTEMSRRFADASKNVDQADADAAHDAALEAAEDEEVASIVSGPKPSAVGRYHLRSTIIGHASRRLHGVDPPVKARRNCTYFWSDYRRVR